jgi:hypothetical protein
MTTALPAMKLLPNLTRVAAIISSIAFAAAIFSTQFNDTLYGIAACAFVVLIAARDYAPKARRWQPRVDLGPRQPTKPQSQRFRLAA